MYIVKSAKCFDHEGLQDSLLAVGDNETLIYTSFHGKNACYQGKSQHLASGYLRKYINRTYNVQRLTHTLCILTDEGLHG